jgi:hypothetical protein
MPKNLLMQLVNGWRQVCEITERTVRSMAYRCSEYFFAAVFRKDKIKHRMHRWFVDGLQLLGWVDGQFLFWRTRTMLPRLAGRLRLWIGDFRFLRGAICG